MAKTPVPSDSDSDDATSDLAAGGVTPPTTPVRAARTPAKPRTQPIVTPTEQLPMDAAPISASAAASGGATGLDASAQTGTAHNGSAHNGSAHNGTNADRQPSVFRRHPVATGVTAGVIAVVLVSGLTAWGVGAAVTASLTSSNSAVAPMPMSTATPAPAAGGANAAGRLAFRATIQSISGTSWTILTRKGQTVTVDVTSSTQFGTKKSAETSGSFAVGDSVIIVATRGASGTPTATRVVNTADIGAGKATTPLPSTTATPNA